MKLSFLPALFFALAVFAQEDTAKLDKAFTTLATFKEGADATDINYLSDSVVASYKDPAQRKAMEKRLLAFLDGQADDTGKAIACRHLFIVGSPDCVPTLAKFLGNERLSHMARFVLEKIPGDAAADALRNAMRSVADNKLKVGMIHSLGRRSDLKSIDDFIKFATGSDEQLAAVAIQSLGKLDSDKAAAAIANAHKTTNEKLKAVTTDAYLTVAARYAAQGKADKAGAIYKQLYADTEPTMTRVAALLGMATVGGKDVIAILIKALDDKEPKIKVAALPCLRLVPGAAATTAIAAELPKQPVTVQPQVLLVLKDRGDAAGRPAVTAALKSPDAAVRTAAAQALEMIGDGSSVSLLAEQAAKDDNKEAQEAARATLARMTNPNVNAGILAALKTAPAPIKVELISALGARGTADAIATLLQTARDEDAAVRMESLRTLRKIADGKHAPELINLLVKARDDGERHDAEEAVVAACKKIPDENKRAQPVLAALKDAKETPVRVSLFRGLGQVGDNTGLPPVIAAASDSDAALRDAAIRALAEWPNAGPMDALAKLATSATDETHRVLAVRGYIRMVDLSADRTEKEKLPLYEKAMSLAARADEKKLVLSKLSELRSGAALKLAKQFAGDEALRDAANQAAEKIEKNMSAPAQVSASHNDGNAKNAIDGNLGTRWETGAPQKGGEWFMIDLGTEKEVSKVVLDATGSGGDYPRGYELYISNSKENFGACLVKGNGNGAVTEIVVTPKVGRYIKIVQTGDAGGLFWSIHELKIEAKAVGQ